MDIPPETVSGGERGEDPSFQGKEARWSPVPFLASKANLLAGLLVTLGILATLLLFQRVRIAENNAAVSAFEKDAASQISAIISEIEHSLHDIEALRSFFVSSEMVTRAEFHSFTASLLDHRHTIQALEWAPRVTAGEREAFERARRGEGMANFHITQQEGPGNLVRTGLRDEYFPVTFVEPLAGNEATLGYDLASDTMRRSAMEEARDSGFGAASNPVQLVQDQETADGILIFEPLYREEALPDSVEARREQFTGIVAAVYRAGSLVEYALSDLPPWGLDVHLFETSAGRGEVLIYAHSSRLRVVPLEPAKHSRLLGTGLHLQKTFTFGGKSWLIVVTPSPEYSERVFAWSWLILLSGFGLTAATAGLLFLLTSRTTAAIRYAESINEEVGQRRLAERRLRAERDRAQQYLDVAGTLLIALDKNGKITMINRKGCEILGFPEDGVLEQDWFERFVPDGERAKTRECFAQLMRGELGSTEHFENDILTQSGEVRTIAWENSLLFDKEGKVRGTLSSGEDITDRKRAEVALLESEERFRAIFNNAIDGILIADVETRKVLLSNETLDRTLGYGPDELEGMGVEDIHPEQDRPRLIDHFERQARGEIDFAADIPVLRKDSSVFYADIGTSPVKLSGKSYLIGIVRDVTARKKYEDEILKREKLESLGVLAGGLAHDFNNILTGILGNVSLAKITTSLSGSLAERLDEIEKATLRAGNLTNQLLTFARGGTPAMKPLLLGPLVKETSLFALSGTNVNCLTDIPADLWNVMADAGQLFQVLSNLMINASQAMPAGGTVVVGCENVDLAEGSHLPLAVGRYVCLRIADSGVGIEPEIIDKIFDPYFTTKKTGTGLGLATVFSIMQKHLGHVSVDSQPEKGTTFALYLPAAAAPPDGEETEAAVPALGSGTILLMDDEDLVLKTAGEILKSSGYEVEYAADGKEALERYRRRSERGEPFDAVILDLTIPDGMGGRETLSHLRRIDPLSRVIVSSGYSEDSAVSDYGRHGFDGAVRKPYTAGDLIRELQRVFQAPE